MDSKEPIFISNKLFSQNFVKRRNPVWILAKADLSDVEILETIKIKHVSAKDETVTLLHRIRKNDRKLQPISDWCQKQGWNCVFYQDMRGSEADVIVMYDVYCIEMEPYSRAKNCLIILQK